MLIVYVDGIIIFGSDFVGIVDLKAYLNHHFHTKGLGTLRYFLRIKVTRSKIGVYLSKRMYVLDLLSETWMLNSRSVDTPTDYHVKLDADIGELFVDVEQYR